MLCGLDVPTDLATMSWMPSVSNTARIGPPAMMPVPAGAERSVTWPAPKWPLDVVMQRAALAQRHADHAALGLLGRLADRLRHLARLAGAVADAALPSPTTTIAAKPKRRPPFTTFATRLMVTSLSISSLSSSRSSRPIAIARGHGRNRRVNVPCANSSERQAALAGGVGQRLDAAVIHVAAAVEHDFLRRRRPWRARRSACRPRPPPPCRRRS